MTLPVPSSSPPSSQAPIDQLIDRMETTLDKNKNIERLYLGCIVLLFSCGMAAIVMALIKGQFSWTIPSAFTTLFLKWPLEQLNRIRKENIAMSTIPSAIKALPIETATKELQNLIKQLYGDRK